MWAPVVIGRYWLFQGLLYMNAAERTHRLAVEALFAAAAWLALAPIVSPALRAGGAVVLAHTASMVFNGHLFALCKHDLYWFGFYKRWDDFADYVNRLQARLEKRPCRSLERAEIFGSLTRGCFSDTSDLDLRFIARPGFLRGLHVAQRVWSERLRALLAGFPLDLYLFHSEAERARKMDLRREVPIVIYRADRPADRSPPFHGLVRPVLEMPHE